MPLALHIPSSLEYFSSLVESDAHFPVLEAAISVAQDANPSLDVQAVLQGCDQLLDRLKRRLAADASAMHRLRMLNQFVFNDLGFGCNLNDAEAPDNHYVHAVLTERRGSPLALALIWLELAQGVGLNACAVGFPERLLVKVDLPQAHVVIDPANGRSQSAEALSELLEPWHQGDAGRVQDLQLFLQALPARSVIALLLHTLLASHRGRGDWRLVVAVLDRLIVLLPGHLEAYRDRGLAHAALGQSARAMQDLQSYLDQAPGAPDAADITACLHDLRRTP